MFKIISQLQEMTVVESTGSMVQKHMKSKQTDTEGEVHLGLNEPVVSRADQ